MEGLSKAIREDKFPCPKSRASPCKMLCAVSDSAASLGELIRLEAAMKLGFQD